VGRLKVCFFYALCGACSLLLSSPAYGGTDAIPLVEGGRCLVEIVRGIGDEFAAEKLAGEFRKFAEEVPVIDSGKDTPLSAPTTIYIGTLASNSTLARAAGALGWRSDLEKLPPESYRIRTGVLKGKTVVVLAGGDRTGTIYAVSDFKNFYLDRLAGALSIRRLDYTAIPRMRYRWFWDWDSRTNWDLLDHDSVYEPEIAPSYSARPFRKRPGAFLKNMKLCVDYMSEHKLNGLIVWGFLRDNHGGAQAAQELCRYANERGVKIIPGVNIDRYYGGIYHEGNSEFNLETRAERYPLLRTMDEKGNYVPRTLCAQKEENRAWLSRAIRWLYDTFPIGGVNLEFAEFGVCYTPDCVAARRGQPGSESDFYKDLARIMPFVVEQVHARAPDTWISYATYGPFTAGMQTNPPLYIRAIPPYAICQWTLTSMLGDLVPLRNGQGGSPWPEGLHPPGKEYIGYIHWNAYYTHNQKGFFVDQYRDAIRKAYRHGFHGIDTYGEESADFPNIELSYLAFSEFSYNPEMSDEDFLRWRVAPLYGGEEAARLVLEITRRVGPIREGEAPKDLHYLLKLAYRGRRLAADSGKARWDRLIQYISNLLPSPSDGGAWEAQ
jgi:hypothetical protein